LVDGRLCRPLVDWLLPVSANSAAATVLEIGPGGGVLTRELLATGARVLAAELDLHWAAHLAREHHPRLSIVAVDALALDPTRLPPGTLVTGNLPFNVGTVILERLLPHHKRIVRIGVMVQKEVADRLVARPGDKAYGALSVLVAAYAETRMLATVKPGSFRPPPKVAAAFIGLRLRPPPVDEGQMPALERTIKAAFGQRRKTLRNSLGAVFGRDQALAMLDTAGIDPRRRAETLTLADFVRLADSLAARTVCE
jgi:16S rRNA (adenine1518-N6/adenine1519-N6)-dimethyltransferase